MAKAELILFDDRRARGWEPFALTRPIGELLFGDVSLAARAERVFGLRCAGYLTSPHLHDYPQAGAPPVLSLDRLAADRPLLFWCSRAVPDAAPELPDRPTHIAIGGQPVGFFAPPGVIPAESWLHELERDAQAQAEQEIDGRVLEWIWDLMLEAPEQLGRDLAAAQRSASAPLPDGVYRVGDGPVILGDGARIEPGALFDTRDGPIRLADGVEVRTGTRLAGPALIGPRSRLLGGTIERIATGSFSYLRGEVTDTVVLGYTNKAHDGHMGHAYLGAWVNLGAFTTNSDLKNNYRPVRVWTPFGVQESGRMKVGSFLGDHVKTGIGLLLGTGTVVGAGANVFGVAMPPTYVPPFSWGVGRDLGEYRLEEFLRTAAMAMGRRGVELDERGRRYLESCWRKGRGG